MDAVEEIYNECPHLALYKKKKTPFRSNVLPIYDPPGTIIIPDIILKKDFIIEFRNLRWVPPMYGKGNVLRQRVVHATDSVANESNHSKPARQRYYWMDFDLSYRELSTCIWSRDKS